MQEPLRLAIDRYDRHFPFFDQTLEFPRDLNLTILQVGETTSLRDGAHRHKRMLQDNEFDIAEVSLSSFIMAKARRLPFVGIPVFPRRLFSQTQMYTHSDTGLSHPSELSGRKVGLQSFQTTLAVLAKGDVGSEYNVDLRSIDWVVRSGETISFEPPEGWNIKYIAAEKDLGKMLLEREIDALFLSRIPSTFDGRTIRRLFKNPEEACTDYFKNSGYFPIMHVIAIREEASEKKPELPRQIFDLFVQAKNISDGYRDDPGWSQLAWEHMAMARQKEKLGIDLWPLGLSKNAANLEKFINYAFEQGLIGSQLAVQDLFHQSTWDT